MDYNNDGVIGADDLLKVMIGFDSSTSAETVLDMIGEVDREGSGYVSYKDFCYM